LLIQGASVVADGGLARLDILSVNGAVVEIGPRIEREGAIVLDASGMTLGPGLIDIHTHGGGGTSFVSNDIDATKAYAAWAPSVGVTGFLTSTVGATVDETAKRLRQLSHGALLGAPAAESLGIHLEGPFLNAVRRGAFEPSMFRAPNVSEMQRYIEAAGGSLRLVTIAPELPGAAAVIEQLQRAGVTVAMGHTDASVVESREGFAMGVSHVTHLFNAMRPFHHREAGAIVAALMDDRVLCELIMDGVHVSPDTLRLAYRLLGPKRTVVVTDNVSFAGTPEDGARFGGMDVSISRGAATKRDGTLVGSIQTMDQHFRNAVEHLGIGVAEAFRICSTNPAAAIGVGDRKGRIAVGYDADFVLLDADLNVARTVCGGAVAYERA